MAAIYLGPIGWEADRDEEDGHRIYTIKHKVETTSANDGPQVVGNCPGIAAVGSTWTYGNDIDLWAFCTPYLKITPLYSDKGKMWTVAQKFSTKPRNRCQDTNIENPLLEPPQVSGSFRKKPIKALVDRNGNAIQTTSFEPVEVEVEKSLPTVRIVQNVPILELPNLAQYIDWVNSSPMWGVPARCVKLSNISWERNLYGTCFYYYTRDLEFEIDWDTWDIKDIPNKGKKAKNGYYTSSGTWENEDIDGSAPSTSNPDHYSVYLDRHGNPSETYLDANGNPSDAETFLPKVEYYDQANLLAIFNLPISF